MKRFLSKRTGIGIVVVIALLVVCFMLLANEKEEVRLTPNYESPGQIVESYATGRLYGVTELIMECIVPEKRTEPMMQTFSGGVMKGSHLKIEVLKVEQDANKGRVTYHATLKLGEPQNLTQELNETVPVKQIDGKWYIDREEEWF
ncbi:hypothetical protein ACFFSY_01605 [Paenibacillus aurantiacus]|uniref:DUF4878 domain-containing protein n=1 Tax=Paenibacillus aurantiacus TaxID=1936118 RepID=A0ABV5KK54_9BACL